MCSPTELSEAIIASLIIAMSLVAGALAALRRPLGDRTALWFALFGWLYGVRLAGQSEFVQPLFPEVYWRYLDAFVTYAITVPSGLFIESVLGPGWRLTLRRTWQAAAAYATVAILHDLLRRQPGGALWLNPPVVLTAGFIAAAHLLVHWRRGRLPRDLRAVAVGALIFIGVAAYQTLSDAAEQLEASAMLVFMTAVGSFVAQRMLAGERRLVAVTRELDLARSIQQSILPSALPETAGLRVAARYLPMSDIGGDFYDFDSHRGNRLGVLVADVTGHGVPAALVASMVKMVFAAEAERLDNPGLVLTNMNRTLCGRFAGAYVTACCVVIDGLSRRLYYSSAGHPAPLVRGNDGSVKALEQRGLLLAFDATAEYATAEAALVAGDRVVLFSDGLVEASNARDEFFGDARLQQLLAASSASTPEQFVDQIIGELRSWVGRDARLQDDVTIVVVDVVREAAHRDAADAAPEPRPGGRGYGPPT
jgi:sigma-B regulation protein RsbU (phosphoserine phosphatase)